MPLAGPGAAWPEGAPRPAGLEGLELRRWAPDDAPRVHAAVTASFDHLHPWLPWAHRPPAPEDERIFIAQSIQDWDEGRAYGYGIFDPERNVLGSAALMRREGTAMEVGYWAHAAHTGRGLIAAAAATLTWTALALPGVTAVRIRCDEANTRSAAVPRRLGYRLDHVEDRAPAAPAETGRLLCWVITRDALTGWR
jgi:RimJ/RimL family protein N-acetyltransferase